MYLAIKHLHITLAIISISSFVIRGALKLLGSRLLRIKWVRILPHIVDTLLLGCGVYMAFALGIKPGNTPWLAAKLTALLAYIGFGLITLRLAKTNNIRGIAYGLAIASFTYMFLVAKTRMPIPF
jgi:uncharacterized membrane protein SirB2